MGGPEPENVPPHSPTALKELSFCLSFHSKRKAEGFWCQQKRKCFWVTEKLTKSYLPGTPACQGQLHDYQASFTGGDGSPRVDREGFLEAVAEWPLKKIRA